MPIVGLTHNSDGTAVLRRSVTTKIAIGLPPKDKSGHPQRLDHFIFQRKAQRGSGMRAEVLWEIDPEKTEHYGKGCREVEIILLDNAPDRVFRTEYAWWTATQKQCWGDGETATRRTPHNARGENWEPCANDNCLDLLEERCRPSGDLYFLLAAYPTLGTICKLHTSSYQSIREIYAALEDIRNYTDGRLNGLHVKLFVRPEKNAYRDSEGNRRSGTKHVLGWNSLLITSPSPPARLRSHQRPRKPSVISSQAVHSRSTIRKRSRLRHSKPSSIQPPQLNLHRRPGRPQRVSKDNHDGVQRAMVTLKERIESAFSGLKLTTAQRLGLLDQYQNNLPALLERLTRARGKKNAAAVSPSATPPKTNKRTLPPGGECSGSGCRASARTIGVHHDHNLSRANGTAIPIALRTDGMRIWISGGACPSQGPRRKSMVCSRPGSSSHYFQLCGASGYYRTVHRLRIFR